MTKYHIQKCQCELCRANDKIKQLEHRHKELKGQYILCKEARDILEKENEKLKALEER